MMERQVQRLIEEYVPQCPQEQQDRAQMLAFFERESGWLTRENCVAHVTASGWILDPAGEQALMVYHNIYRSWSWTGGHADGEGDLLKVALREAEEETGVRPRVVLHRPFSLETLCVEGHLKRGQLVSPHLHLNVTYLLEAEPAWSTQAKPDENAGVRWIPTRKMDAAVREEAMRGVYRKLIQRAEGLRRGKTEESTYKSG